MRKPIEAVLVTCDGCGADLAEHLDFAFFAARDAEMWMADSDWRVIDGSDYCPDCYRWDDDDNLVVIPREAAKS